tara:strand:+ start:20 stop:355 length:336 start_codon:yes stop_codon:yes gene_type:complete
MKYEIRYIERGVDVDTDSKLLDMMLETDKTKLADLSDNHMCQNLIVNTNGRAFYRAWLYSRNDYKYTLKTVDCDSFNEVFEKYNAILHNGARVALDNIELTIFKSNNIEYL